MNTLIDFICGLISGWQLKIAFSRLHFSKVNKPLEKPVKWWYYKLLCEFWYYIYGTSNRRYYKYLNLLCDMGFNLYGDKI